MASIGLLLYYQIGFKGMKIAHSTSKKEMLHLKNELITITQIGNSVANVWVILAKFLVNFANEKSWGSRFYSFLKRFLNSWN